MLTLLTVLFSFISQIDSFEGLEKAIALGITVISLLLLALSVTAYRKTHLRITIYAIIIFALFAIQQFIDYLDDIFVEVDIPITDVVISSLTLTILAVFFLAIVLPKNRTKQFRWDSDRDNQILYYQIKKPTPITSSHNPILKRTCI